MQLDRFIEATLRRTGALAEACVDDLVETVLPGPVAAALGLPEASSLRLRGAPGPGEVHAGYGSDLLSRICSLAETPGRLFRLEVAAALPKRERVEREIAGASTFGNAVGRVEALDESDLGYLVFDFRYAALSEERHEGALSVAINLDGGWSPGLPEALPGYLADHPEARRPWTEEGEPSGVEALDSAARALARSRALDASRSFVARMERRLQRDTRRVNEYYESLGREAAAPRTRSGQTQSLPKKLEAIEAEKRRRLRDVRRRYAVTLRVEPLSILAFRTRGLLLRMRLQRRKGERAAVLAWNPIARRFDRWLCSTCGGDAPVPYLCDALHVTCASCPPDCPLCGQLSCGVCRPDGCRCGWRPGSAPVSREPAAPPRTSEE